MSRTLRASGRLEDDDLPDDLMDLYAGFEAAGAVLGERKNVVATRRAYAEDGDPLDDGEIAAAEAALDREAARVERAQDSHLPKNDPSKLTSTNEENSELASPEWQKAALGGDAASSEAEPAIDVPIDASVSAFPKLDARRTSVGAASSTMDFAPRMSLTNLGMGTGSGGATVAMPHERGSDPSTPPPLPRRLDPVAAGSGRKQLPPLENTPKANRPYTTGFLSTPLPPTRGGGAARQLSSEYFETLPSASTKKRLLTPLRPGTDEDLRIGTAPAGRRVQTAGGRVSEVLTVDASQVAPSDGAAPARQRPWWKRLFGLT